jgi:hypothetical protein
MSTSARRKKNAAARRRYSRARRSTGARRGRTASGKTRRRSTGARRGRAAVTRRKPSRASTCTRKRNRSGGNCQKSLEYTKIRLSMCTKKLGRMVAELRALTI